MFGLRLGAEGLVTLLRNSPGFMDVLSKYGADAHMWIPGVGMIDGFMVQNWQDGDGTIPATVGNPVGRVEDIGGGTVALIRDVDATRPTLALDINNKYAWTLNGSFHKLPLARPVFQMSDDFCVVAGVALASSGSARSIFAQSNGSNHALPELMFDNTGRLGAYALGGGTTVNSFGGSNNANVGPIVASMVNIGGAIRVRRNSVQVANMTASGTYATATTAAVGAFPTLNASEFLAGDVYPVVAIKGTVSDADLRTIEQFVEARSTMIAAQFDFLSGTLDPRITFTRSSAGTYWGSDGLLKTAGTNLLAYSENYADAYWTKSASIIVTGQAGPFGGSASKLVASATNAEHSIYGGSFTSGVYTASIYAKAGEYSFLNIRAFSGGTYRNSCINLLSGTYVGGGSLGVPVITPVGNGWYRCSVSFTGFATAGPTTFNAASVEVAGDTSPIFFGDNISGIFIFGAHVETGRILSTYAATRGTSSGAPRFDHDPATPAGTTGVELASIQSAVMSGAVGWSAIVSSSMVAGKIYKCSYRIDQTAGASQASVGGVGGVVHSGAVNGTFTFTTQAITADFAGFFCNAAFGSVTNFSVQEVIFTPRGLLIEGQSTNLLTNTRDMSQSTWFKTDVTVTRNQVGVDGVANSACKIVPNTGNVIHRIYHQSTSVTTGNTLTASVFAKAAGYRFLYINGAASGNRGQATFDLQTGTVSATANGGASITAVGNGWYRCTVTAVAGSTSNVLFLQVNNAGIATNTPFAADGVSGILLDCAQLEVGAFATSPIIAGASQATRAADVPLLPLVGSSWLQNTGSGTFVFDLDTSNSEAHSNWWDAAPTSNQFSMRHAAKNTCEGSIFGVWVTAAIPGITASGGRIKAAVAFSPSEAVLVINGVVVASVAMTGSTIFTTTNLHIGKASWGVSAGQINDHYAGVTYFGNRKGNAELQALTAP